MEIKNQNKFNCYFLSP